MRESEQGREGTPGLAAVSPVVSPGASSGPGEYASVAGAVAGILPAGGRVLGPASAVGGAAESLASPLPRAERATTRPAGADFGRANDVSADRGIRKTVEHANASLGSPGAVLVRPLMYDELGRLERAGQARSGPGRLPPSVRGKATQLGWVELMQRFELDTFFTMTFSDRYAVEHFIRTNTSALNNFERWVKNTGLPGNYFVAPEPHLCRDSPHLHGLLQAGSLPRRVLWADWFADRGRARLDPPRSDAAAIYCAKYAIKEGDSDGFRFRFLNPAQAVRLERKAGRSPYGMVRLRSVQSLCEPLGFPPAGVPPAGVAHPICDL